LGRYLTPVEHPIFDALRCFSSGQTTTIAKGLTQREKAQVIVDNCHDGYWAVGLDASRFDQCIGRELLKLEHSVYTALYKGDRDLVALLKQQLYNRGVHYGKEGMARINYGALRCSGDMNTSLGNCIISVLLAHRYCVENGVQDKRLFCDGDDLLLFVRRRDLPKLDVLEDWYLRWGLRMKIEAPACIPEKVEFCQSRPVLCGGSYTLIRDPRKCLNCDFSGFGDLAKPDYFKYYLRSVGVCGKYMTAGCPVLQAWYDMGVRCGATGRVSYHDLNRGFIKQAVFEQSKGSAYNADVTPTARMSFALAFGIDEGHQLWLEDYLNKFEVGSQLDSTPTDYTHLTQTFSFYLDK
jgi:hypothetical protein